MTKTTNLCLFLAIATILIVSPLASESVFADPNHEDKKDKKSKTGEHKLKCKSIGSWFNPNITLPSVFSSSEGKCSAGLGHVTSASVTTVTDFTPDGCLTLSTAEVLPAFSMGKKGFIEYDITSTQCFFAEDGVTPVTAGADFCGDSDNIWFSTVSGTYHITGGLVKDTTVTGGDGTLTSWADHCATGTAPNGNSFTTELEGTIVFP